jgi:hypothetical protein
MECWLIIPIKILNYSRRRTGLFDWLRAPNPRMFHIMIISSTWQAKDHGMNHYVASSKLSQTGTRTRVAWVKATYPNRLDYLGARLRNATNQYLSSQIVGWIYNHGASLQTYWKLQQVSIFTIYNIGSTWNTKILDANLLFGLCKQSKTCTQTQKYLR